MSYILGIFLAPDMVRPIWDKIGLKSFNEALINRKWNMDSFSTQDFSSKNLEKKYNETLNTALETKKQIEDGIHSTKESIDDFRAGVESTKKTVENGIETFNKTKKDIEETTQKIQEWAKKVQEFSDTVQKITQ